MEMDLANWFHDDITWCLEENCPIKDCMRNPVNMRDRTWLHSFAMFKGTDNCPIEGCMDKCRHAEYCFRTYDDPNEALRKLMDEFCDKCIFAEQEED